MFARIFHKFWPPRERPEDLLQPPRPPRFGIFEPILEDFHCYLPLLNLHPRALQAISVIKTCCNSSSNAFPDISLLLEDSNWRPHLVGAVVALVSGHKPETIKLLWNTFDKGSWVTPQIGAALLLIDPDFPNQARSRLENGCPIDFSQLKAMNGPERHHAAGPAGGHGRVGKAAATLVSLLETISPRPPWVSELRLSTGIQELLAKDKDNSGDIATDWLRIKDLIAALS